MSSRILNLFRAPARPGRRPDGRGRAFGRDRDGTTVVEFAIIIIPFIALLFAIIEVALVFYAGQVLETATADSARRIMTGQVQKAGLSQQAFKDDVCSRLQALFDCPGGVHVDVKNYAGFVDADITVPGLDEDGELDTSSFGFSPGAQGSIVVVRVVYQWPTFMRDFGLNLATLPNGKRLLMATAAFRNEPYKN